MNDELLSNLTYADRIALHVGRYLIAGAEIDRGLTRVVSRCINPLTPTAAEAIVEGEMAGKKLEMLRKVLPPTWNDGAMFLDAIRKTHEYRNRLAHSTVEIDFFHPREVGGGMYTFDRVFQKERASSGSILTIDLDELSSAEQYQEALRIALLSLQMLALSEPMALHTNGFCMGNLVAEYGKAWHLDGDSETYERIMVLLGEMFPPDPTQRTQFTLLPTVAPGDGVSEPNHGTDEVGALGAEEQ